MTKQEYSRLQKEYEQEDNKHIARISYVHRCFYVGDDEEYQLLTIEDETVYPDILEAIRSIVPSNEAEKCIDIIKGFYEKLYTFKDYQSMNDVLEKYIWNPKLYNEDYDVWEAIVCGLDYDDEYSEEKNNE